MTDPVLRVQGLHLHYRTRAGNLAAVRDVSFEVQPGEIVGIVGESGCGKSTVASAVLRLLPPNGRIVAGEIVFKGEDLVRADEERLRELRGREISMIFQDPMTSLNPVFTIEAQMVDTLAAHRTGQSRPDDLRQQAIQMLERVGIPDAAERIQYYPHQFSGGMRQRIMIAMALMTQPSLLIADEPTSALDVTLEAQILDLIRELRAEFGTAILYISHDLGVMAQLCDRLIVMYAGNLVEAGSVQAIFDAPKHPYTQALLDAHPSHRPDRAWLTTIPGQVPSLRELPPGCKFAPRCHLARPVCATTEPRLLPAGPQHALCHVYDPRFQAEWAGLTPEELAVPGEPAQAAIVPDAVRTSAAELVVAVHDVRVHFPDQVGLLGQLLGQKGGVVRAVDGLDLTIHRGETLGLVGESGSGKTTLGRAMLRLERATSGQLVLHGQDLSRLPDEQVRALRARMQMIFQDPVASLSPRLKVATLLLEPFRIHDREVSDPEAKVLELLQLVGLSAEQADKYPHELSGGQARRVGIARALALRPQILIADEPTAGLDVSVAASILNLLKDLRARFDLTYLIITHNLNVIRFIANRVGVMYLGRLVELGVTDDLFERPLHPYTEALLSAIAIPDPRLRAERERRIILKGEIPSPKNPPRGCPFHPRCRYAQERCRHELPELASSAQPDRWVACHFPLTAPAEPGLRPLWPGAAPEERRRESQDDLSQRRP